MARNPRFGMPAKVMCPLNSNEMKYLLLISAIVSIVFIGIGLKDSFLEEVFAPRDDVLDHFKHDVIEQYDLTNPGKQLKDTIDLFKYAETQAANSWIKSALVFLSGLFNLIVTLIAFLIWRRKTL